MRGKGRSFLLPLSSTPLNSTRLPPFFQVSFTYSSVGEKVIDWARLCRFGQVSVQGLCEDSIRVAHAKGRMGHVAKYWNLLNNCQIRDYVVCQKESSQLLWKSHRGIFPRKYCKNRINYEKFAKTSTTVEQCDISRAEKTCPLVIPWRTKIREICIGWNIERETVCVVEICSVIIAQMAPRPILQQW